MWTPVVLSPALSAAGAQDTLTIARCAHLVGGCRMGSSPEDSVIDRDHRAWASRTCSCATAA
jgi:choline dehydrogenase-like flavoprotein